MDVLLALAVGVEMELELLLADAPREDLLVARIVVLGMVAAVAVRRSLPVLAAALGIAVVTTLERLGDDVTADIAGPFFVMLFVSFSVGAHSEGRELVAGAAVLLGGAVIGVRLDNPPGGADDIFFAATLLTGGPLLLGRVIRARLRVGEALSAKAAAVESGRAARAAQAVADERARIAGELHHLVRAALSSMVGQAADAERLARSSPAAAEQALAAVEETGRDALGEIRQLLGVLRREDEELALAPQPSLAHVADLVARMRAAGLPVELEIQGTQGPLPAGVDLTAYRILQEALGGALEAPGARRAAVRLRYADDAIGLEVTDFGAAPAEQRRLLGIYERVALYGGDLVAAPVDESGYAVRARLPLERAA